MKGLSNDCNIGIIVVDGLIVIYWNCFFFLFICRGMGLDEWVVVDVLVVLLICFDLLLVVVEE